MSDLFGTSFHMPFPRFDLVYAGAMLKLQVFNMGVLYWTFGQNWPHSQTLNMIIVSLNCSRLNRGALSEYELGIWLG
jgi:hypothetical protein